MVLFLLFVALVFVACRSLASLVLLRVHAGRTSVAVDDVEVDRMHLMSLVGRLSGL